MDPRSPRLPRDHPLAGCEQKLWRAQQHLELLDRELQGIASGAIAPAAIRTEEDPNAKHTYRTVITSVAQPPIRLATTVGDIVHNLRSSLDYLVFELAFLGLRGRRIPEKTAFPVSRRRSNWHGSYVQGTLLEGVMQKHRAMLYKAQPCYRRKDTPTPPTVRRRARHYAADLERLWNEDKHRMIQFVALMPIEFEPTVGFSDCEPLPDGLRLNRDVLGKPLEVGTELLEIATRPTGPDPKVRVHVNLTMPICLPNGFPIGRYLADVYRWVEAVIASFEPEFETPRARTLWGLPRGSWIEREVAVRRRPKIGPWEAVPLHRSPSSGA